MDVARKPGCILSYDPNLTLQEKQNLTMEITVIKISEEEIEVLTGGDYPYTYDDKVILLFTERLKGVKVKQVDTTGAGDAFVGGLLNSLASDPDLYKGRLYESYTRRIEKWMETQKTSLIYELIGSLPPFLLVFAGHVRGSCRDLHAGPVSLLHWSSSGKPWLWLDSKQPCPLDSLWSPFDLYGYSP